MRLSFHKERSTLVIGTFCVGVVFLLFGSGIRCRIIKRRRREESAKVLCFVVYRIGIEYPSVKLITLLE